MSELLTPAITAPPWTMVVNETKNGTVIYIKGDTGHREVAVIYGDSPQKFADARVILAGPALLSALKRAVETIRAFHGIGLNGPAEEGMWRLYQQSPEMKEIHAALAKAEGGELC